MTNDILIPRAMPRPPAPTARVWSEQQNAIFDWARTGRGNLIVRARAGTGKTTTILEMLEHAPERKVLLAAFNKSIARELQSRVRRQGVEAKTLHGLGLRFIKNAWGRQVDVEPDDAKGNRAMNLARMSAPDAPDYVHRLIERLHTKARELVPNATARDVESLAYRYDLLPDESWVEEGFDLNAIIRLVLVAMQHAASRTDVIDFADMIFLPIVHKMARPWYELVVVDEAQDMTQPQLQLARSSCKRTGRIVVVGDDRQAIYAFRGADSGALDRLKQELKAQELGLHATYRCGKVIVALARELVPDFVCGSTHEGQILRRTEDAMLDEASEGDFILSRTNAPLIKVCMQLLKRGVRARIKGRDIGRGILAVIRKLHAANVAEIPQLLDARTAAELEKASSISNEDARAARIEFVQDQAGIILALLEGAATVEELCRRCEDLFSDDAERGAVMCSSVHRAKGLETDRVYLIEETFRMTSLEEQNLRYVAITRAKHTLTWVR